MFKDIFKKKQTMSATPPAKWYLVIVRKNGNTFTITSNDDNPPTEFENCVEWFVNDTTPFRKQPMWDGKGCVALRKDDVELIYITPHV